MSRGGARPGAGRPKGQGPHGEPTKPIRIPLSMVDDVLELIAQRKKSDPTSATDDSIPSKIEM